MRSTIPTLSLLGALMLLPACATRGETPAPDPEPTTTNDPAMEVIALQHAQASELHPMVEELLDAQHGSAPQMIADERLNALIVRGSRTELARVKELVALLDVAR